jgi:predicted nucleic acid-binding protein
MSYFLDTSALVKIYHRESGTGELLEIYKGEQSITISQLAKIEFFSTMHRKLRDGEIDGETLGIVMDKFEHDTEERYEIAVFTSFVLEEAYRLIGKFARRYSLRTLDSLQFAFFTTYHDKGDIFVCADKKLIQVVQLEGYSAWIPENA